MADLTEMTDQEMYELIKQMEDELGRRQTRDILRGDVTEVIKEARQGGSARKPEDLEQWVKPRDVTEAYIDGERVTDNGKAYISRITPNVCNPKECRTGWHETEVQDDEGDDDPGDNGYTEYDITE